MQWKGKEKEIECSPERGKIKKPRGGPFLETSLGTPGKYPLLPPPFSVSLIFTVLSCFQELDESRRKTVKLPPPSATPHCQFCDVTVDTQCVTVLLENPVGCRAVEEGRKEEFARKLLQK